MQKVAASQRRVTLSVRVWIEINPDTDKKVSAPVTLSVRVWIEIYGVGDMYGIRLVTLSVRVWIEISHCYGL